MLACLCYSPTCAFGFRNNPFIMLSASEKGQLLVCCELYAQLGTQHAELAKPRLSRLAMTSDTQSSAKSRCVLHLVQAGLVRVGSQRSQACTSIQYTAAALRRAIACS